jgi:hypothetical protein
MLLVEAVEERADVTLFAEHAVSYVDGVFMEMHDQPPQKRIAAPRYPCRHSASLTIIYLPEGFQNPFGG